jgi:hypothetical protein
MVKILFLPVISAILPKGTRNTAPVNRYEVAIQPKSIASVSNSLPIEGRAMFTEELMKGMRKEAKVTTNKIRFLVDVTCDGVAISNYYQFNNR